MPLRAQRPILIALTLGLALVALAALPAAADGSRAVVLAAEQPQLRRGAAPAPELTPLPAEATPPPAESPPLPPAPLPLPTDPAPPTPEPIAPAQAPITAHGGAEPLPYEAARLVELVNAERAAAGLEPLAVVPELTAAAMAYSAEMAASGVVAHTGADGRGPAQRLLDAGYRWLRCGENLAVGQPTPEEAVAFWMGSPPHRANMLDPGLREIGAGYAWQPGGFVHYWTIELGVR